MDSNNNGFVEVEAQDVQLYYNTASKNYSLEFYIQDFASAVPNDKVKATTTYEAIGQQETLTPAIQCTHSAGASLYFDITIETNQQDLSEEETEYTLAIELPELVQGKQANNDPVIHVRPTIKYSGGRKR
ncbi:MAG: hypothetical protein AB8E82_06105 [Aureispira sp.]